MWAPGEYTCDPTNEITRTRASTATHRAHRREFKPEFKHELGRAGDRCDDRGDRRFGIHQLSTYITFKLDLDMYSYFPDTHTWDRQRLLPGFLRQRAREQSE